MCMYVYIYIYIPIYVDSCREPSNWPIKLSIIHPILCQRGLGIIWYNPIYRFFRNLRAPGPCPLQAFSPRCPSQSIRGKVRRRARFRLMLEPPLVIFNLVATATMGYHLARMDQVWAVGVKGRNWLVIAEITWDVTPSAHPIVTGPAPQSISLSMWIE